MKTIFYDVDTQNDFMNPDGALYVPDAELIKPNLSKLTELAREKNIPITGSVDRHFGTEEYKEREGELAKFGGPFPDHCMNNTTGQFKIAETSRPVLGKNMQSDEYSYFHSHYLDGRVNEELLKQVVNDPNCLEIVFEKQSYDVFTNPAIERFLDMAKVEQAVVYGVATDYCVKAAVLGMQERGIQCYVIKDAIKGVAQETTEAAIKEMKKAGARFLNTDKILEELVK